MYCLFFQRCSNPQFLCTVSFRNCDGLDASSLVRFTVYDVREKLSQTAVPLGTAELALGHIQDTNRLRIPLRSTNQSNHQSTSSSAGGASSGFITLSTWSPDPDRRMMPTPARSPAKINNARIEEPPVAAQRGHRRSQSLPPKLGVKLFVPPQAKLALFFANPSVGLQWLFIIWYFAISFLFCL